jgi:membrane-associated protease RseP (regulator of RpoE activity)
MSAPGLPPPPQKGRLFIHVFLFVMTLFSTWFVGAGGFGLIELWLTSILGADVMPYFQEMAANGLVYMASIMGILLSHEMGHYLMARKNRVDASLPYFIPMPFLLFGTLGAVIVMKGRIRSRNALMEVGAMGPLAGLAVALPVLIVGLSLSEVGPIPEGALLEGQSILYMVLKQLIVGDIPEGYDVMLHPMAWAGWIGLLITMLNLLPIGQLDGGHIFYALFGEAHRKVSRGFLIGLFLLGAGVIVYSTWDAERLALTGYAYWSHIMVGMNWLLLGLLLLVLFGRKKGRGFNHPPTDDNSLSPLHRVMGISCLVIFVVCFMPIPIRILL